MRYVQVARLVEDGRPKGYELNPDSYLERLSELASQLPKGARRFATDDSHYNFFGPRCVKDLRLATLAEVREGEWRVQFDPNPWKHDHGLELTYQGVRTCLFEPSAGSTKYGTVLLDELLPAAGGMTHEVALTGGTLRVTARDLEAVWR